MLKLSIDIFVNSLYETLILFPYLYLTYLLMEYLEHVMSRSYFIYIKKSKQYGPIIGGFLGLIPQCGFSVSSANLYRTGLITLGTMFAIFLSTSDEMVPILISRGITYPQIIKILSIKMIFAIIAGLLVDLFLPEKFISHKKEPDISAFCKQEKCKSINKKESIFMSAYKHTEKISIFIFICAFVINYFMGIGGLENIKNILTNVPILSKFVAAFVGLIPSCYPSILLTQLYAEGTITLSTLLAGSFSNAGLGLLVLYRINPNKQETLRIIILIYGASVVLSMLSSIFF
ncbi:MAG: arsenic efflux protein [Alphaproteobacteria bacterium]|nr:arsenic efflux protein [Alphaproteobacteria bacterium]